MTLTEQAGWALLAVAGLAGSAVCSGFETGSYTVDRLRLDAEAARGDRLAARLAGEIARPTRLLATILVSNNIANYAGSLGLAALLAGAGLSDLGVIVLNAIVLTPMLLIFGEILPKEIFRAGTDRITAALSPVMFLARVLYTVTGIVPALTGFGRVVSRLTGARDQEELLSGRERTVRLLQEGVRAGVLTERQSGLIDRAMALRDATAGELMRPWRETRTLGADWSVVRARERAAEAPRNRYVVVDKRGKPAGEISAAALWATDAETVKEAAEPVVRVAPTVPAREALNLILEMGARVAIVEKGAEPVGVATVRSLIEPLTGELGALEV